MTLTIGGCEERRAALIKRANADVFVILNPRHIFYFSNLFVSPLSFGSWGLPFLIIEADSGKSTLVVDNFLGEAAESAFVTDLHVWTRYDVSTNPAVHPFRVAVQHLTDYLKTYRGKRIGIETGWLPHGVVTGDTVDVTDDILAMRRCKYPDEITLIREALRITEAGHRAVRQNLQAGMTEIEMHSILYSAIANEAGYPILMLGDVVSGERAAKVSGPPTTRKLSDGELIIFDVAPIVNGYRADFTATLCVGGKPTDEQLALEKTLHQALDAGVAELKPGASASTVFRAVYDVITNHGWSDTLRTHVGHGLGLGHPEAPYLVANSDETIVAGDIITLEPGIYAADWGVRIEHNYLVTDTGVEQLTHHLTSFA